jgi:iron complex transport system ATP-binding protein
MTLSIAPMRYSLRGVSAAYGRREALSGVDLDLAAGEVVALLGENGSGKSTLLKLLAGLLPAASGTLTLDGRPLTELPRREAARRIGYLPQSFEPLFPATALEMVLLGRTAHLGFLGAPAAEDRSAARRALEETDTAAFAGRDVREMSGGERQRVFLSRVLAGATDVLLLDEPAANLDPRHRFLVVRVLRRKAAAGGLVVFSTHELDVAAAAADRVVLLRGGQVDQVGPVRETLTAETLTRLFGVPAVVSVGPAGRPLVSLAGDGPG